MSRIPSIFIIISFAAGTANAQDYQLIRSGKIAYFADGYNEIKCIRIDSAETEVNVTGTEIDSILYPMGNIQLNSFEYDQCATPFGSSWIGKKVVIQASGDQASGTNTSGDHLFFNKYEDTIRIKSGAQLGDSWIAFRAGDQVIEAIVIKEDTLSFLGLADSVKTIRFQVFNGQMDPVNHVLNDQTMMISKNFGAVKILNFYQFPGFEEMSYGFVDDLLTVFELAGLSSPGVGVQNLTWFEVFDFQPGDEIHTLLDEFDWYAENAGHATYERTIRRFLSRADYPDSVVYNYERKVSTHSVKNSVSSSAFLHDTTTMVIHQSPEFNHLPGEVIINSGWAWSHFMHRGMPLTKIVPSGAQGIWGSPEDSCWSYCCADGCFMDESYCQGLGGPYGECTSAFSYGKTEKTLVYYKKGEETWGIPYDLTGIEPEQSSFELRIYPNPVSDQLWIEAGAGPLHKVMLLDMTGKLVYEKVVNSNQVQMDLGHLKPGFYILKATGESGEHTSRLIIK